MCAVSSVEDNNDDIDDDNDDDGYNKNKFDQRNFLESPARRIRRFSEEYNRPTAKRNLVARHSSLEFPEGMISNVCTPCMVCNAMGLIENPVVATFLVVP